MRQLNNNAALAEIIWPYYASEVARVSTKRIRPAYYTSAETAISVIRHKTVWYRDASLMNDFNEIRHGYICFREIWNSEDLGGVASDLF